MTGLRFIVLFAAACGHSPTPAPAPARAPATREACYAGPSQVFLLPANTPVGDGALVARRTTDPGASTITEDVAAAFPGQPTRRFAVVMTVAGSTFTMTERGGAFSGDGDLVGAAWQWTSWTSRSHMPDGTVVTATDRVTSDGFAGDKTIIGPDGVARVHIVENVIAFDCGDYEQRIAALSKS